MRLSTGSSVVLGSVAIALALSALSLSIFLLWRTRGNSSFKDDLKFLTNKTSDIADHSRSMLNDMVNEEELQSTERQIKALSNNLQKTREEAKKLQADVEKSRKVLLDLQNRVKKIESDQKKISVLQQEKQMLADCIEDIEPIARKMKAVPSYFSSADGILDWFVKKGAGTGEAADAIYRFNITWGLESGACSKVQDLKKD